MPDSAVMRARSIIQEKTTGETSVLPWSMVHSNPEYRALPLYHQAQAKLQYFDSVVAPQINEQDYQQTRNDFLQYTGKLEIENEKPSFWREVVANSIVKAPERAIGVALGAFAALPSFAIAGMMERELDRESFDKLPFHQQILVSLGAGFESAGRAMLKEGDWGTRYSDYYKAVTGETIEDTLPTGLKWAAPTLEFLAEASFDPIISAGSISDVMRLKVPKEWIGKMPKKVLNDLKQIEALEATEKTALQERFLNILNQRKGYMQWWDDQLDKVDLRPRGEPLYKPGERTPKDLTAPRQAMVGQPKQSFSEIIEREVPELSKTIQESIKLKGYKPTSPDGVVALRKINEFRKSKGWGPVSPLLKEEIAEIRKADTLEKLNAFRKKKGLPTIETRATAGLVYGIDEDENGNITYDIGKGIAGGLAVAGGMSLFNLKGKQKFTQTLLENPAWAKINGAVGKIGNKFTLLGALTSINTKLFDRFAIIKKTSPDAYAAARTFSAYKDEAFMKLDELKEAFKPVKKDEVVVSDYINAHRMLSRTKSGIKNPDNITAIDAQKAIEEIENYYSAYGKDVQKLRQAKDDFQKWTHDYILKEALDSGVISKKGYDAIIKNNSFYATFEVLDYLPGRLDKVSALPGGEFFSVGGQRVIQKMSGTEKKISDPLEATLRKFVESQNLYARNKVANIFIDDPNIQGIMRPVASSKKEFAIMKNKGLNPIAEGTWDQKEFGTISRIKDGRIEKYVVDADIAGSMKQLTPYQAPKAIQAINAIFRKSATTVYVPFTISNAFRDAFMAYTTAPVYKAKDAPKFAIDWSKGFWEGLKHEFGGASDLTKQYIKSGGGFGYVGELRKGGNIKPKVFAKKPAGLALDIVNSPFDLIEKLSAAVELAPRLGVYRRAGLKGISSNNAALMARAATIDFNRGGTLTKAVNQWVPFLNARIQGRLVVAEAIKNRPGETLSKIFVSTVLPGIAAYAWNRAYHSDLYDDIPEYVKQNYFTIITGTETDEKTGKVNPKYFVISKGDVGQLAFNPIEFAFDKMFEKDPESAMAFFVNYLSDLSPVEFARRGEVSLSKAAGGLLPPVIKGFAENWSNLSFYRGTEIVPYYMGESKPPELQYKENTPESYKWLGKKLRISPLKLQNFAGNVLAGYGREGLDPSAMLRGLTGRLVKTTGGEIDQQAWTTIKDIEQGYMYIRAYAEEMIKEGDRKGALNLFKQWNLGINEQVESFNKKYEKYGIMDRGGIIQSYAFTRDKVSSFVRSTKRKEIDQRRSIEKKVNPKARGHNK